MMCNICSEALTETDISLYGHGFHMNCLQNSRGRVRICPQCRPPVTKQEARPPMTATNMRCECKMPDCHLVNIQKIPIIRMCQPGVMTIIEMARDMDVPCSLADIDFFKIYQKTWKFISVFVHFTTKKMRMRFFVNADKMQKLHGMKMKLGTYYQPLSVYAKTLRCMGFYAVFTEATERTVTYAQATENSDLIEIVNDNQIDEHLAKARELELDQECGQLLRENDTRQMDGTDIQCGWKIDDTYCIHIDDIPHNCWRQSPHLTVIEIAREIDVPCTLADIDRIDIDQGTPRCGSLYALDVQFTTKQMRIRFWESAQRLKLSGMKVSLSENYISNSSYAQLLKFYGLCKAVFKEDEKTIVQKTELSDLIEIECKTQVDELIAEAGKQEKEET